MAIRSDHAHKDTHIWLSFFGIFSFFSAKNVPPHGRVILSRKNILADVPGE
jgi:hypothetical protein